MSAAKHTPTPWKCQDHGPVRAGYPNWKQYTVRSAETNVHIATVGNVDRYYEGAEGPNAEFIVRAVNSHDALVAALLAVVDSQDTPSSNGTPEQRLHAAMILARAALAKAGAR